jgi:acyl phosphate:glycerol-3-phosphate acyltransferase
LINCVVTWVSLAAIISYLIGSIPSGYIAGKMAGIDIRSVGSGNIGATNVTRSLGKRYGYPVFLADFAKGPLAIFVARLIAQQSRGFPPYETFDIVAAVFCLLGNAFPVWLGFRGGKGVAVSAGLLFALMPWAAVIVMIVWLAMFYLTGYVSLASIIAALALPVSVLGLLQFGGMTEWWFLYVAIGLTALVVLRHRSNISRIIQGTEHRFHRGGD